MGDRYYATLDCDYCGEENSIYYAPDSGIDAFNCIHCGATNRIEVILRAVGIDDETNNIQQPASDNE